MLLDLSISKSSLQVSYVCGKWLLPIFVMKGCWVEDCSDAVRYLLGQGNMVLNVTSHLPVAVVLPSDLLPSIRLGAVRCFCRISEKMPPAPLNTNFYVKRILFVVCLEQTVRPVSTHLFFHKHH